MKINKLIYVLICGLLISPAYAGESEFDAKNTWVFAVTVLDYKDKVYGGFPKEGRKDDVLIETLKARGVPSKQVTYLKDKDSTIKNVKEEFEKLLGKTKEGDTLFFYFAGHGSRVKRVGPGYLILHDTVAKGEKFYKTALKTKYVIDQINKSFAGKTAIITADCCFSGMLSVDAEDIQTDKVDFICLNSVIETHTSTGKWTFTESMISAFGGFPYADFNGDNKISLSEARDYSMKEMTFVDQQIMQSYFSSSLKGFLVSPVKGSSPFKLGSRLMCKVDKKWLRARILDEKKTQVKVEAFEGYDVKKAVWIDKDSDLLKKYEAKMIEVGTVVQINFHGRWFEGGKVLEQKHGLHRVKRRSHDFWISGDRLRPVESTDN